MGTMTSRPALPGDRTLWKVGVIRGPKAEKWDDHPEWCSQNHNQSQPYTAKGGQRGGARLPEVGTMSLVTWSHVMEDIVMAWNEQTCPISTGSI